ncbi:MAG: Aspartate aminotransferase (EC 2.6.1.1) [Olavius algarvensis Gamma 3 endosymbiont]|nr:MAG: Aspartate aminotransferase (EC 2.6.1.1) [Olavius algarvensis Gamma 3 endosymbiont]
MKFNPNVLDCAAAPIAEAWSWVRDPASDNLIDMCQAVPAHLPPQSLRDYLGAAIMAGEGASYTDIRGIPALREALAEDIGKRYRGRVSEADVLITAGCNQAFCSVVDTLCQAGDEIILPLPCYFNHQMWLAARAVKPRYLSFNVDTAMPDPEEAAKLINSRTRAILLVTPNNPSGAIYSPRCIEAFFELAREHGLALILDETYRDFIDIDQVPHKLFARGDWRDTFVHLYSFSKVFSLTGFRTGAVAAGQPLIDQLKKIQDCTAICAPHAGQLAALYGLNNLYHWKLEKSEELAQRAIAIKQAFSHPDLRYRLVSAGAYFAYVEHPFEAAARDVVKDLIQKQEIVCLPGSYFGRDQEQFIRLAYANVHESRFEDVIGRLIASQQRRYNP